ncbi:MAG: efflux RND transporter periplasmic adaptor subunit [Corallincola sp.]|nr:efflux RND transporter periplasmic adaptor subunit [Corallincola sp.]
MINLCAPLRIRLLPMTAAALVLAAIAGCSPAPAEPTVSGERPQPVVVASPERRSEAPAIMAIGRLAAVDEVPLAFLTAGVVAEVAVDSGDLVQRGELLARLDITDLLAERQQAVASLDKAERDLRRASEMHQRQLIAAELRDNARTARDLAAAAVTGADYRLARSELRAASAGRIIARRAEPGEVVAAGQPVVVMAGGEQGWLLKVAVADRHGLQLALGQPAAVTIDGLAGPELAARISRIDGAADAHTATLAVELQLLDPPPQLRSGLVGRTRLTLGQPVDELRVPLTALVVANDRHGELFVVKDGRAERRTVELGRLVPPEVVIVAGLAADEQVVVAGAAYLHDGSRVEPQPATEAQPVAEVQP